jgi:Zn-dependent alcohol dehydrogenase
LSSVRPVFRATIALSHMISKAIWLVGITNNIHYILVKYHAGSFIFIAAARPGTAADFHMSQLTRKKRIDGSRSGQSTR